MKMRTIRAVDERTLGFVVVGTIMVPFLAFAGVAVATMGASLVALASLYLYLTGVVGSMVSLSPEEYEEYMKEQEDDDV
jgi:hypothetical protein